MGKQHTGSQQSLVNFSNKDRESCAIYDSTHEVVCCKYFQCKCNSKTINEL